MCDIHKYDEDNYQIDGEMYSSDELGAINTWHQVSSLLGTSRSDQMREYGFRPTEVVKFMNHVAA